jgi:dipeptidyl aminopeptidase/acylaminoacyl peptidase
MIAHPDNAARQVEYFVRRPTGAGPWPTVVFLHGHQNGARRPGGRSYVDWGVLDRYAAQGYLAVAVSLPGYGASSGPADFAGPSTRHAVAAVIDALETAGEIKPNRLLIEGVSLGAVTGALVAADDPHVSGLVLISGLYDLSAYFAHPPSAGAAGVKAVLIAQTGGGADALQARSALPRARDIKAATLILAGAKDDRTDPLQAAAMAAAIRANGGQAAAHVFPDFGHEIPVKVRDPEINAFIDATLKP